MILHLVGLIWDLFLRTNLLVFSDFSSWGKISTLTIFSQWTGITNQQAEMINSA